MRRVEGQSSPQEGGGEEGTGGLAKKWLSPQPCASVRMQPACFVACASMFPPRACTGGSGPAAEVQSAPNAAPPLSSSA